MATILLVEDDNNLREIYEARLQAEGYEISSAHDGEEALVMAKEKKPDLIIADVMMPKISGFEMLDILRNTAGLQSVKIIMLTALGQSDDQDKAAKLGADRYLVKSQVTLEDIVNAAHELLESDAPANAAPPTATPSPTTTPLAATPVVSPTPEPSPTATPADNSATDDKIMDEAVTTLGGDDSQANTTQQAIDPSTPTVPDNSVPTPAVPEPDIAPVTQPVAPVIETETATPALNTAPTDLSEPVPSPTAEPTSPPPPAPDANKDVDSLHVSKGLEELLKRDNLETDKLDDRAPATTQTGQEPSSSDPVPIEPPPEGSSDYLSDTSGPQIESAPGASMKVIKPIPSDSTKKDINKLLEEEGLNKEQVSTSTDSSSPAATEADTTQVVQPTEPANPTLDQGSANPNDIAL